MLELDESLQTPSKATPKPISKPYLLSEEQLKEAEEQAGDNDELFSSSASDGNNGLAAVEPNAIDAYLKTKEAYGLERRDASGSGASESGTSAQAEAAGNKEPKVVAVVNGPFETGMVMYMGNGTDTCTYLKTKAYERGVRDTLLKSGQYVAQLIRKIGFRQVKVNRYGHKMLDWHLPNLDDYEMPLRELKDKYESGGRMWFEISGSPPCFDYEKKDQFESDMKELIPGFSLSDVDVKNLETDS